MKDTATIATIEAYDLDDETIISVPSPKTGPPLSFYSVEGKFAVEDVT